MTTTIVESDREDKTKNTPEQYENTESGVPRHVRSTRTLPAENRSRWRSGNLVWAVKVKMEVPSRLVHERLLSANNQVRLPPIPHGTESGL